MSGVELTKAQIVLLGKNKAGAGGRYRIGHSVIARRTGYSLAFYALQFATRIELPETRRSVRKTSRACGQLLHEMLSRPSYFGGVVLRASRPPATFMIDGFGVSQIMSLPHRHSKAGLVDWRGVSLACRTG